LRIPKKGGALLNYRSAVNTKFGTLLQTIILVTRRINPALKVTGILLCMFDTRALLPSEVKADIEQFLAKAEGGDCPWSGAKIIPVHVRRNIKLAEAPSYGKTIFEYEPKCHGAADYQTVAEYIHSQTGTESKKGPEPVVVGEDKGVGEAVEKG
jgi:chromosome partitioning protein